MEEISWAEIEPDPLYEYDAPHFYDFASGESVSDDQDAQRWFDNAKSYPPSPFAIKMKRRNVEMAYSFVKPEDGENPRSRHSESNTSLSNEIVAEMKNNHKGSSCQNDPAPNTPKLKTKAVGKFNTSTLMRPTASYLAKQNHRQAVNPRPNDGRSQKTVMKCDQFSRSSSLIESQTTKRQKLESGYLSKAPQLKQHTLIHKVTNKSDMSLPSSPRLKVTVPREPNLATARRAQRYRPASTVASRQENIENDRIFKARPLNKKEFKVPIDRRLRLNLPIDAFSKLSLTSNSLPASKWVERSSFLSSGNWGKPNRRYHGKITRNRLAYTSLALVDEDEDIEKPAILQVTIFFYDCENLYRFCR